MEKRITMLGGIFVGVPTEIMGNWKLRVCIALQATGNFAEVQTIGAKDVLQLRREGENITQQVAIHSVLSMPNCTCTCTFLRYVSKQAGENIY